MIGMIDKELSEKLQLKADLALENAAKIARQNEPEKSQIKDQTSSKMVEAVKINKTSTSRQKKIAFGLKKCGTDSTYFHSL